LNVTPLPKGAWAIALLLSWRPALAANPNPTPPAPTCNCASKKLPDPHVVEITFGSSQLFAHQSILGKGGEVKEHVIPVTSALMMAEWLMHPRLSLLSIFNLPLVTQKIIVDGAISEQYVAPSVAAGLRFSVLRMDIFRASQLDLQVAGLGGITIGSQNGDVLFPLVAGRIHLSNRDGFALYFGSAYAFQKDTVAVLYGIGYRF
jgi:hypothetical protein